MKNTLIMFISLLLLISCAAPYTAIYEDVETEESLPEIVQEKYQESEIQQQKADLLKKQFRPPAWILGTWGYDEAFISFEFKERDVLSMFGGYNTSFKDIYKDYITDSFSSDNEYSFTVKVNLMEQTYRFIKRSATSIDYHLITDGKDSGAIGLVRK